MERQRRSPRKLRFPRCWIGMLVLHRDGCDITSAFMSTPYSVLIFASQYHLFWVFGSIRATSGSIVTGLPLPERISRIADSQPALVAKGASRRKSPPSGPSRSQLNLQRQTMGVGCQRCRIEHVSSQLPAPYKIEHA